MNKYTPYKQCVVRTPLFPINYVNNIQDINLWISQEIFKDAIYIASPVLYEKLYTKNIINEKTTKSALKYFTRSCTRCTPFGIFAGCDVITVDRQNNSKVTMSEHENYKTYTRIDMDNLCDMIRKLESVPQIKKSIKWHKNTTTYFLGKNLRYIEYSINRHKRKYTFSEIIYTRCISKLIKTITNDSFTIEQLALFLVENENVVYKEAVDFINALIDEQILISDLQPSVVGVDLIHQLNNKLLKINYRIEFIDDLIKLLQKADGVLLGNKRPILEDINKLISSNIHSTQGTLVQVDCQNKIKDGIIGKNILKTIDLAISFFSRFQQSQKADVFTNFKKKFYDKYEEQEIPLVVALDTEVGISYGRWTEQSGDINPLLKGMPEPLPDQANGIDININPMQMLLIKKYEDAVKHSSYEIKITDEDLKDYKQKELEIPQCAVMFSLISNTDEPTILMNGILGGASSRLISRFEYLDPKIENLVNTINERDELYYEDCVVAEILHLPEDRIGNIQMHPNNRQHGICYLSNPITDCVENIISVEDIMVSIPYGQEIILRSKKLNKRIIPMLSTAHNTTSGLPIYSFLSDYINQETRSYSFDWGIYFQNKPFLPRVSYSNIILKPARWLISSSDIFIEKQICIDKLLTVKRNLNIPDEVLISSGDNQLYINFNTEQLVNILLDEVAKTRTVVLTEFLYSSKNINLVESENGYFANEIILNLYR